MQWDDIPPVVNYLVCAAPEHPLANARGLVAVHRWLLFARIGPGHHACHWCGTSVTWLAGDAMRPSNRGALVVDHLDGHRGNNEPENLVPSCHGCNLRRAAQRERSAGQGTVALVARRGTIGPACRCGCGVPAHRDTGLARGRRPCLGTAEAQFWARVDRAETCWPWVGTVKGPESYGRFLVGGEWVRAHRYAWTLRSGAPIPEGFDVLHTCDVKPCVRNDDPGTYAVSGVTRPRFGHLWLGTHADNMADRAMKGKRRRPEPTFQAKLTDEQVREIRAHLADGVSHRKLAAMYGVSKGPISAISCGRSYHRVH